MEYRNGSDGRSSTKSIPSCNSIGFTLSRIRYIAISVLDSLAGEIFLVNGNHDRCHIKRFTERFVNVSEYMEIEDEDRNVVLCHYPIPCFKNHFYGWYHLYGHVHNSFEARMMEHDKFLMNELYDRPCQMFNVGAMMPWMDYTPRTLDEIITTAKEETT